MEKSADITVLFETGDPKRHTKIFQYGKRKFKIYMEHTSGKPLGFNFKCAVSIMKADGTWEHIADNKSLDISWRNYFELSSESISNRRVIAAENSRVEEQFIHFIKSVY